MAITAADIRREVKEKNVTFLRLMFSDIYGTFRSTPGMVADGFAWIGISQRCCHICTAK